MAGTGVVGGALAALSLILAPAIAAPSSSSAKKRPAPSLRSVGGSFTPAVADPSLAAELARRGLNGTSFRFTPTATASSKNGAVRVAVRARAATPALAMRSVSAGGEGSASPVTAVTPTAYNIGATVGWRGLAVSGDVAEVKGGALPGTRRNAAVGVSYSVKRFTGRVEAGVDKTDDVARITPLDSAYSVGVGGSYQIARNIDVTGGVRYKIQSDRLEPLADQRRDSQAVYIGTAFRF
ncbi:MAG TPA: porin [Allosphingosinicella sp.]